MMNWPAVRRDPGKVSCQAESLISLCRSLRRDRRVPEAGVKLGVLQRDI